MVRCRHQHTSKSNERRIDLETNSSVYLPVSLGSTPSANLLSSLSHLQLYSRSHTEQRTV